MDSAEQAWLRPFEGERQQLKRELIVFLALSSLLSWPLPFMVLWQVDFTYQVYDEATVRHLFGNIPELFGCGPMLAAIAVTCLYRGKAGLTTLLKTVVKWKVPLRWYGWALLLPVLAQWAGLFAWAAYSGSDVTLPPPAAYLSTWLQITLFSALYYVTEEFGWRGFMLPRFLVQAGWVRSSLLLGLVWSFWHYPLWFLSGLLTSGSIPIAVTMLAASTLFTIAVSVIVTWIVKGANGSVLLAMLFHGASQANLTKMHAAAGLVSLTDPGFRLVQAVALAGVALLLVLAASRRWRTKGLPA